MERAMPAIFTTVLCGLVFVDGVGFLIGFLLPLYYAFTRRVYPVAAGIHLLDGGPFKALGMDAVLVTGLVFVAVSGLKILALYWLWDSRRDGAILELILLGLSTIFWYGFELPFGPPIGIAQVVLIALVWGTLH
jgi:hypothetical protein